MSTTVCDSASPRISDTAMPRLKETPKFPVSMLRM